ncbi:MAG: protease inhibitor I42 family protein [Gammaproteobacteria bacterium]|nr:protease inhibitor I42 family protein [Gammaproteobacteria bacterium]
MKQKYFFSWLLFACILSVDACSSKQVVVDAATCARFEIRLPANPTTGFQWTLERYDKERFDKVKDKYFVSDSTRMGSPGEHVFYFKQKEGVSCPELAVFCFRHARSWESDSGSCTEVTVHFSKK